MKRMFRVALAVAIAAASGMAAAQSTDIYNDDNHSDYQSAIDNQSAIDSQSADDNDASDSYVISGNENQGYRGDDQDSDFEDEGYEVRYYDRRYDDRYGYDRYDDRYSYRDGDCRRDSAAPIVGAVIGGVIGNQFGHGRDRDLATIAGAGLGYAAGVNANDHCYGGYRDSYRGDRYGDRHRSRSHLSISIGGIFGGHHRHHTYSRIGSRWDF